MNPNQSAYHQAQNQMFQPKHQQIQNNYENENFSDENYSPVRPSGIQTQQTAPLRDGRNKRMK